MSQPPPSSLPRSTPSSPSSSRPAWVVSQIGNREHYAIACGLARRGLLTRLVTDFWRPSWVPSETVSHVKWKPFQRWLGRHADGLDGRVTHFDLEAALATAWHYKRRGHDGVYDGHIAYGRWFARKTARAIATGGLHGGVFFGYNTACLEAIVEAKQRGFFTVVDQMDPARTAWLLVEEERRRFPTWEERSPAVPESYWRRLREEWDLADLVVVNSEWSRDALIGQGVPAEKLAVVPLAYDPPATASAEPARRELGGPLRVLWLGTVSLGKGIPYLLQAAAKLPDVQFHVAGPLLVSPSAVATAPPNVKFHGQVPHLLSSELYRSADVFVLPTITDGFAITQLEAMSWGLPVIATSHCGRVVKDGYNGYIVPVRDSDAIASRLAELDADRGRLAEYRKNALGSVAAFSLDVIMEKFLFEVDRCMGNHVRAPETS